MNSFVLPNYVNKLGDRILVPGFNKVLLLEHKKSGLSFREAAQRLKTSPATYAHYLHGRTSCSIKMLKKFCELYDCNLLEKAFNGNFAFSGRNKEINLPRTLTLELAYYVGYLQGDGYLGSNGKRLGFTDEYRPQMEKLNSMTYRLFGKEGKVVGVRSPLSKKPCYNLEIKSTVINSFLNTVFEIPKGIKQNLAIPSIIAPKKELLRHYIAGLYDADGTLPKSPSKAKALFLDITLKDRAFVEEIKDALQTFDIKTLPIYKRNSVSPGSNKPSVTWELRIRRREHIFKFLQEINFYHPEKARRSKELEKLLKGL